MLKSPFEGKEDLIGSKLITQNLKAKLDEFMNESNDSDFDRKVFGIFGSWGIGKSTILDEMAYLYDLGNQEEDNTKYKIIRIDLWKYELLNSDLEAMTNDILKQISRKFITKKRLNKVVNYIARVISGTKVTHGFNIPPHEEKSILDKTSHTGKTLFEINNVDDGKKIGKYDKVLIVFDELDRCSRINMERYLNYIKNISAEFSKKIYSAVVLDKNYLAEALFDKSLEHCNKFLEKIIKHEFDIEQKIMIKFKAEGERFFSEDEFADLVKCCNNNIRKILEILGQIEMLLKVIKGNDNEQSILVAKLVTLLNKFDGKRIMSSRNRLEQVLKLVNSKEGSLVIIDYMLESLGSISVYDDSQVKNINSVRGFFEDHLYDDIAGCTIKFENKPILEIVKKFILLSDFENWAVEFWLNNSVYKLETLPILVYVLSNTNLRVEHNIEFNYDAQLNWKGYFETITRIAEHYPNEPEGIDAVFDTARIASEFISNKNVKFNVSSKIIIESTFKNETKDNHFDQLISMIIINYFSNRNLIFTEANEKIVSVLLEAIDFL
jgi:ribosomal protein S13